MMSIISLSYWGGLILVEGSPRENFTIRSPSFWQTSRKGFIKLRLNLILDDMTLWTKIHQSRKAQRLIRSFRWVLLGGLIGIFGFLAWRGSPYLAEITWIPEWLGRWADANGVVRNLPAFAMLTTVIILIFGLQSRVVVLASVMMAAVVLELGQWWLPGRVFDWKDVLTSWLGVGVGFIFSEALARVRRRGH
jgi:hypothetical protein